jgi:uncharacterized SAM-binding protein YcdF (DUF218 family)
MSEDDYDDEDSSEEDENVSSPPPAKLTYALSPARRGANLAKLKSIYLKQNNSAEAKAMFDELFTTNMYSAVDAKSQSVGMSSSNFCDVFAMHIAASWEAAHAVPQPGVPETNIVALAEQMKQLFSRDQNIRSLNDAQKQLSSEELIAQTLVASALYQQGKTNLQMKQAGQNFGRAALKQLGFDYTKFKITSEGFEPL